MGKDVIIGIGVPGVGKTTHLKRLAKDYPAVYVSLDALREELLGYAGNRTQDEMVWGEAYRRIELALDEGQNVIIDGAGTNPDYRRDDIKRYRQRADRVRGYWFQAPLEVCLERNRGRQVEVPEDIVRHRYEQLQQQPPTADEGFDEVTEIRTA